MGRVPIGVATVCCLIPYVLGCQPLDVRPAAGGEGLTLEQPAGVLGEYSTPAHHVLPASAEVPATKGTEVPATTGVEELRQASCPTSAGPPEACEGSPGVVARCRAGVARLQGWLFSGCEMAGREPVEEIEHIHPRFFPVPTRPVFWPRRLEPPPIAGGPFPEQPWAASAPARPAVELDASAPVAPMEIHVPESPPRQIPAAPVKRQDRETQAPRPLWVAGGTPSWLFRGRAEEEVIGPVVGQSQRHPDGGAIIR